MGSYNFLEQLVGELYEFKGCLIKRNIFYGKGDKGGKTGEMDVVAFDPKEQVLYHIETSGDASSWDERIKIFKKKFESAKKYYKDHFPFDFSKIKIKKVAVVSWTKPKPEYRNKFEKELPETNLISIPELIAQIIKNLKDKDLAKEIIPESMILLRTAQVFIWQIFKLKKD